MSVISSIQDERVLGKGLLSVWRTTNQFPSAVPGSQDFTAGLRIGYMGAGCLPEPKRRRSSETGRTGQFSKEYVCIYTHTTTYTCIYVYVYIYIYTYM